MTLSPGKRFSPLSSGGVLAVTLLATLACEAPMDVSDPAAPGAAVTGSVADATATEDTHSYARPQEAKVTHITIDWSVDFAAHILDGFVELELERARVDEAGELILDSRDLAIRQAEALVGQDWQETSFSLGDNDENLGQPLTVALPAGSEQVRITYATSPQASGLQWLAPEQTAGGRQPFLFSQAQAIHARSMMPCQDSPAVRITFDATLRVPDGITGVMAATLVEGDEPTPGVFRYEMPLPVPSYLIAVAAGDLKFGELGPRSGVWAEPELLDKALNEFVDLEAMIDATEGLYGPYRWRRYDLLVLPPAFPFGGMENPMLTFLTPTVLAGDRSLVGLIAHELAHSWSGNLVTNATWSDFWLNEGFTSYIEKRIMEEVYGQERAEMEWVLGRQDLDADLISLADTPADQKLHIDLTGRNPDDGMTSIAYEKGAHFLRRLEEGYGRDTFDPFIRGWFDDHAFTSVTTGTFRTYLQENLVASGTPLSGSAAPDIETWINGTGLPDDIPAFTSTALAAVDIALERWHSGAISAADLPAKAWNTQQWLHFVRGLPADLDAGGMAELDAAFALTDSGNSEVLTVWMEKAIQHGYDRVNPRLEEFLTTVGRRKFLQPLYEAMMETETGRQQAQAIYAVARPRYHAIAVRTLDEVVEWNGQS